MKAKRNLTKLLVHAGILLVLGIQHQAIAHNKVVVIPLFDDAKEQIRNVVTVAKQGGDFESPIDAMASIQDASIDNPYLIAIAPGEYSIEETLVTKPFVSIVGSGQSNTRIVNTNKDVRFTLSLGSSNDGVAELSDLTIENSSGGTGCTGLYIDVGFDVRLENLTVIASGCSISNLAIDLDVSSARNIKNITAIASGGIRATGMQVGLGGRTRLQGIDVLVSGASSSNRGLNVFDGALDVFDSRIRVVGNTGDLFGIKIESGGGASIVMNSEIEVVQPSGANPSFGIHLTDASEIKLRGSTIISDSIGLFADSTSTAFLSSSTLTGSVGGVNNTGTKKCVACDNNEGVELSPLCL